MSSLIGTQTGDGGPFEEPNELEIVKSYENHIIFFCFFCFYNDRVLNSLYRNYHLLDGNYFKTELKVEDLSGGLFRGLTELRMAQISKIVVYLLFLSLYNNGVSNSLYRYYHLVYSNLLRRKVKVDDP